MIEARAPSVCPICGFTEDVFAKTFKLGCSHCYQTFAPHLETMLCQLHRGTTHLGKSPEQTADLPGKLRRELIGIESLLRINPADSARADALLERWREVSDRLARAIPKTETP